MEKLYIIIPAYNEEANIENTIKEWYPIIKKHNGNGLSAHFDMVVMYFCFLRFPTDVSFCLECPTTAFLTLNTKWHQGDASCQKNTLKCFHVTIQSTGLVILIRPKYSLSVIRGNYSLKP